MTPFFTRCFDKGRLFVRGAKPTELSETAKITARQWKVHQNDQKRENPIQTGFRYLKVFEQNSVTSYAKAAQILGVSRIRVYQMVSLVTKLPREITDYVLQQPDDQCAQRHFTERRLRPLTVLKSDEEKVVQFGIMVEGFTCQNAKT